MPNLMARGMSMLNRTLGTAAGIDSLVITPLDGLGTITVTDAVFGRGEVDVVEPGRTTARRDREEADFLIPLASLVRSSSTVLPKAGDRYAATVGGTTTTYQAMQANGRAVFDYCDHEGTRVRVRTKRVP
jgi:hypothetical protein